MDSTTLFNFQPESGPQPPQIPDHDLLRCIGSGAYGEVWLARNVMGTCRAVKIIYRDKFPDERTYGREYRGMEKFEPVSRTHEGFVDILQVGRNEAAGYYYCVMELGDDIRTAQKIDVLSYKAKTLGTEIVGRGKIPPAECVEVVLALSSALAHLHRHGLIHRDIKPSNIIFVNGIPKIADIGLVAALGNTISLVGTEGFIPPEGPGSAQADIYALGKVLYQMSTGHDARDYPTLPTRLDVLTSLDEFLELNEVFTRACETRIDKRYRSAEQMHADLVLLQAGKSLKRLRTLERRMVFLMKAGAVAAVVLGVVAAVAFEVNRGRKMEAERIQQKVGRNVAYATRLIDEGDYSSALPPLAEALSLDQGNKAREETRRMQIAAILQQCPRIVEMCLLGDQLNGADLSRDGRLLVTAGRTGMVNLVELTRPLKAVPFLAETNEIEGVSFSADGRFISISREGSAEIWEAGSRKRVQVLPVPGYVVFSARFSPDGKQMALALGKEEGGAVWLWNLEKGSHREIDSSPDRQFRYADFSPRGDRLIATRRKLSSEEPDIGRVWDLQTFQPLGEPMQHGSWVLHGSFSPDGKQVVTTGYDNVARISDASTGRLLFPPLAHEAPVRTAEFSPDGRYVLTVGWDFGARIWSTTNGVFVPPILKHSGKYLIFGAFTPDSRRVVTADVNGVVLLWDLAAGAAPSSRSNYYIYNERTPVSVERDSKRILLRDIRTSAFMGSVSPEGQTVDVKMNADGKCLVTISTNPTVGIPGGSNIVAQVWSAQNGTPLSPVFSLDANASGVSLSDDGRLLMVRAGTNVHVLDARSGARRFSLAHTNEVKGFTISSDGRWIVSISGAYKEAPEPSPWSWNWRASVTGSVATIWEGSTGRAVHSLPHPYELSCAEFSPDGTRLVTCMSDSTLFERAALIWDVKTGRRAGAPLEHADGVRHAMFSPNGRKIVTASEDSTARVWNAETGEVLLPPLKHSGEVNDACFSPDGKWIATACEYDGTARIWDADTGEPLTPPLRQPWYFKYIQFVNGGRAIATRRSSGQSALWNLPSDEHSIEGIARLAQLLSGHHRDYTGNIWPQRREALHDTWGKLRAEQLADLTVSTEEVAAWHQREAEMSEETGRWSAALFHWEQLIRLNPADPILQSRREIARARIVAE